MRITIADRHGTLGRRLQKQLAGVALLQCDEHHLPVVSVVIDARENGWFDCRWTTCCEGLEARARAIVGSRCPQEG
jgi:hypothetical protein